MRFMTTQGQGHPLTFQIKHFQTSFPLKITRPFEAKFHIKPPWDVGMKICSNVLGHIIKIASRSIIDGKNLQKSPSSDPRGGQPWNLEYSIGYSRTSKFIQMMPLGWPWPFLWHSQICFLMLLHGWKLIIMYFQACSNYTPPLQTVFMGLMRVMLFSHCPS